jgi:Mg2+ and Co2+ transporter CorA
MEAMQRDEETATHITRTQSQLPYIDESRGSNRPSISRSGHTKQALQVSAYFISKARVLKECEVEDAVAPESDDKSFWIDADVTPDGQEDFVELREKVLDKLTLSPFMRRHLKAGQMQRPQVLALSKAALVVVRILPAIENSGEIRHAAALCLKGLLVTVTETDHRRGLYIDDTMIKMLEQELPTASATGALCLWLSFHLDRVATSANRLRTRIFATYEQMDKDVSSVRLEEIIDLKDSLLHTLSVAEEQRECIESLSGVHPITQGLDFDNLKGYLGVLLSMSGSTERSLLRLEKRVADLRHTYDASQQDRINRRLAILTILSAIFLPLTLMAGIWGMNFSNMPGLERENGYFYALASMAAVASMLIFVFYYHGWFSGPK